MVKHGLKSINANIKKKKQSMKAQRGSRGIVLLFLQPPRYNRWVVNATPLLILEILNKMV